MRCPMKEIKILHLLPKLLSLYGEYGNVAVFANELRKQALPSLLTAGKTAI